MTVVLDASALLALIFDELGAARVEAVLADAIIGSVSLSEVVAKLQDKGVDDAVIAATLANLDLTVRPFDRAQAILAGKLRNATRAFNISFGDRACLALAKQNGCVAVTGDRDWTRVCEEIDVSVEVFR